MLLRRPYSGAVRASDRGTTRGESSSGGSIIASTIDSSAHIAGVPGTTGTTVTTASAISPGSTIGFSWYATLTAVSSVVWVAETNKTVESSGSDLVGALVYGDWVPATTVA